VNKHLEGRRLRYARLSSVLAGVSDRDLIRGLAKRPLTRGWGGNQVLQLGRDKVFVKRVPVTDKELANAHSTRNLYNLPLFYNYGVGSAGFGVFRELLAHVKTTNWVLEGASESFPLMFHQRIVANASRRTSHDITLDGYVQYWSGSKRIGKFMLDRAEANHEVLIFLEHFPHTAGPWLVRHEDRLGWMHEEMESVAQFLRAKKVLHFDGHLMNIVTDGTRAYLTDFGLVQDMAFDLSPKERTFFRRNTHFDRVFNYFNLGAHVAWKLGALSKAKRARVTKRYGLAANDQVEMLKTLLVHVEEVVDRGFLELPGKNLELVLGARPLAQLLTDFFARMRKGSRKDFNFDDARAKRLLSAV